MTIKELKELIKDMPDEAEILISVSNPSVKWGRISLPPTNNTDKTYLVLGQ